MIGHRRLAHSGYDRRRVIEDDQCKVAGTHKRITADGKHKQADKHEHGMAPCLEGFGERTSSPLGRFPGLVCMEQASDEGDESPHNYGCYHEADNIATVHHEDHGTNSSHLATVAGASFGPKVSSLRPRPRPGTLVLTFIGKSLTGLASPIGPRTVVPG